ncbi:AAA family ATPase [Laspinema sp. C5]|nr:AAA family ATPase [Laspinema sp. D3c]
MDFNLKRLRMRNWRCYQDKVIDFTSNSEKPIWIIFGQNGFGKTSILEAIQWCLYGSDALPTTELLTRFNRIEVKNNPETELLVNLILERNGHTYDISRIAKIKIKGTTKVVQIDEPTVYKNGLPVPDSRERIEEILPRSCKEFFFFDGVEIKRYAKRMHTEETRNAIERILGIPELRNLREDAEKAMQTIDRNLAKVASSNEHLKKINDSLQTIQDNIEATLQQLEIAEQDYKNEVDILTDIKERASQLEGLRGKLEELKKLEREEARLKENLNHSETALETALRQASIPLMREFVVEIADRMQRNSFTTARRSGSLSLLQELLKEEICVCGRCIDDSAREYLRKELDRLEESTGSLTKEALQQDNLSKRLVNLSEFKTPNFQELLLKRDGLEEELEETQQSIYRLKGETKGINDEEAQDIWKKVGQSEQSTDQKKSKIERLNNERENLQKEEDKLRREREKLAGQDKETATLARQAKLARGLYQAAGELIEWRIGERKQTIEAHTSEIHLRVTNKSTEYRGVKIRSDYTLGIENAAGEIIEPETLSAGEKEALAFAFIAGLNLASGTAAPLIMDTPFGHFDTKHHQNVVKYLTQFPSQVIVLATDRDFPPPLLEEIRPHVAKIFKIRRLGDSEDSSTVEVEE